MTCSTSEKDMYAKQKETGTPHAKMRYKNRDETCSV